MDFLVTYEPILRLSAFLGLLCVFIMTEHLWPHRGRVGPAGKRWINNSLLMISGALLTRVLLPAGAVGAAIWAETYGYGLLNIIDLPLWARMLCAIVLLDLAIYLQHLAMHHVPLLWRLHRIHHTDTDLDVTSAVRFHPLEISISMGFKIVCVTALGAPAAAVILFEVILNGAALFHHSNTHIPTRLDRWLRLIIITPHLHHIHHSPHDFETNSNFGFSVSIWDRLFGTYRNTPQQDSRSMTVGLDDTSQQDANSLIYLLIKPLK